MQRILILGSSGQIGTALMHACKAAHIDTVGIDLRPNTWDPSLTNTLADACTVDEKNGIVFTDIVFLATDPSAKRLEAHPEAQLKDIASFHHAAELALKHHARLVIISSRELFGLTPDALSNFNPKNAYERQKQQFEMELLKIPRFGILRVPIVYGGFDTDIERLPRLVPRWCKEVLESRTPDVTNGDNTVELLHIETLMQKILLQLNHDGSFIEELHGESISLSSLAQLIIDAGKNKNSGASLTLLRRGINDTFEALGPTAERTFEK